MKTIWKIIAAVDAIIVSAVAGSKTYIEQPNKVADYMF
jgi:hypothetical protein